ncbi:BCS1 and AAA domain-containing protein [Aspergillus saccharolyticus JOP 1030-1]|uniref:BCS1-like ATPase n=1 Tax=Aspergillus saccharolyticus JOP 1030-1 TaxID=1450539 RepID=A0A319A885_9EURO|nr:hypothetical protein BP01DRAFT_353865 [Aspergillus saccharolyticus JOP 1030-1]PYH47968.1 hypothetical protein BP01DRAFT_353865 [Aspergillus saccharolyticus JOP 1030-1]
MNATAPVVTGSETAILEGLIPGYAFISRLLLSYLQIDLSLYIPYIITATCIYFASDFVYSYVEHLFWSYFMASAEVRIQDDVYTYLMFWISRHRTMQNTVHIYASTQLASGWYYYNSEDSDQEFDAEIDEEEIAKSSFDECWSQIIARDRTKRLRFTPSNGVHHFQYKNRTVFFHRIRDQSAQSLYMQDMSERLIISCFGRDTTLLKQLLADAQAAYVARDGNHTIIYRGQKANGHTDWVRCMARAPRALSTVVLDQAQKDAFVNDIKEYLHPRTRRWYSNRGIPYRRGYLLHGPPGTGKTSLSFAAAGVLGVPLYLLNLSSKTLDEDDLMTLFHRLPRRCIILLEDVDCAGITQKRGAGDKDKATATDTNSTAGATAPGDKPDGAAPEKQGISLSGLLNVIDGVAANEGRILIMTTNHPEKLDAALLRPGRVDMSIAFGYAQSHDVEKLFASIYSTLEGDLRSGEMGSSLEEETKACLSNGGVKAVNGVHPAATPLERISELARRFAAQVPSGEFTAAEVQGYLLNYKSDPHGAIEGAAQWLKSTQEMRQKRLEKLNLSQ